MVVSRNVTAAELEAAQAEVGIVLGEVAHQGARQDGDVPGGADLARVGQTRGVYVLGVSHPELLGPERHQGGELSFRSAQLLGHGDRDVVGGFHRHGADRLIDGDAVAGPKPEPGRRLVRGVRGDHHAVAQGNLAGLQRLEGQVERHQLGDGRRIAGAVGVALVEHLAGIGVDDDGRIARLAEEQAGVGDLGGGWSAEAQGGERHGEKR